MTSTERVKLSRANHKPLTPEQLADATRLRARGWNVNQIAQYIHRDLYIVLLLCRTLPKPVQGWRGENDGIPNEVLFERDKRLALAPRDLTAAICGDPLPGHSALERRA